MARLEAELAAECLSSTTATGNPETMATMAPTQAPQNKRKAEDTCPSCASESAPKMVTIVVQYEEDKQEGIFTVAESLLYRRCPKIQNWPNTTFIIQPGR
ncbi:hypothetical protein LTR09_006431 [Extremus antarcticus]|uniref:Uncharacterized protein n=1 Tax=Extremus antarcticus TaxID=702011 RepID=A0AAJ0GBR3_9PEZI|nr:hypothetical protein LTR09_006431 [Extremus antarcticus]